jgi:MinD-like ATPase involved in chromosome partitioning or flagellar assembly
VILRPDTQDYQGTSVTLEVAQKLGVPQTFLVLNKVLLEPGSTEENGQLIEHYRQKLGQTYRRQVGTILPLAEEMIRLESSGLFILQSPNHLFTQGIQELGEKIVATEK